MSHPFLSDVAISNLYTKGVAVKNDPRQAVPCVPTIPDGPTRLFLARLIIEEALETVIALGIDIYRPTTDQDGMESWLPIEDMKKHIYLEVNLNDPPIDKFLEDVVDGCADTIYVCVGAMLACGVPDKPHLLEVCRANDSKFPGGVAITDGNGKYQKPPGWKPPSHATVMEETSHCSLNLQTCTQQIMEMMNSKCPECPPQGCSDAKPCEGL